MEKNNTNNPSKANKKQEDKSKNSDNKGKRK